MTTKVRNSTIQTPVASANTVSTQNFTVQESGGKLIIQYNGATVLSIDSTGNITSANNVTAGGTP